MVMMPEMITQRERNQMAKDQESLEKMNQWSMPTKCDLEYWRPIFEAQYYKILRGLYADDQMLDSEVDLQRKAYSKAVEVIVDKTLFTGLPGWAKMRRLIFLRDDGICWGCGNVVDWEYYELGHIVDRLMGGLDVPDNLAVMCVLCNRNKPFHRTREQAEHWARQGGFMHSSSVGTRFSDDQFEDAIALFKAMTVALRNRRHAA